jgi:hypothetical protein
MNGQQRSKLIEGLLPALSLGPLDMGEQLPDALMLFQQDRDHVALRLINGSLRCSGEITHRSPPTLKCWSWRTHPLQAGTA